MAIIKSPPSDFDAEHPGQVHFFSSSAQGLMQIRLRDPVQGHAARHLHSHTAAYMQAVYEQKPEIFSCFYARTDPDGQCIDAGAIVITPGFLNRNEIKNITKRTLESSIPYAPQSRPERGWRSDPNGASIVGGRPPEGFSYPERAHPLAFQYLGFVSNDHLPVPVDGDGLHLIFPLLHYDDPIRFFDISNPMAPTPLKDSECALITWRGLTPHHSSGQYPERSDVDFALYEGYQAYEPGDELHYEMDRVSPFDLTPEDVREGARPHASHPSWIHDPEVPICPVTGEAMLFLGQFGNGAPAIENEFVRRSRALEQSSSNIPIFNFTIYAGDRGLFGFYHPVGKTMCIVMQI